jgi:hypothetical protein
MNRLISIISTIVLCGIFTGCDKYLDLEPSEYISENVALTSDENVKHVLQGLILSLLCQEYMEAISSEMRNCLEAMVKFNG